MINLILRIFTYSNSYEDGQSKYDNHAEDKNDWFCKFSLEMIEPRNSVKTKVQLKKFSSACNNQMIANEIKYQKSYKRGQLF